jgi:hypothetical protein
MTVNPLMPSLRPTIENGPMIPTTRPTLSRDICRKKVEEVEKGLNSSLSMEIVSANRNVSYLQFGEFFTECAPPVSEFLVQYQADLSDIVKVLQINESKENAEECETRKDCTKQGTICVASKCVDAGQPLFALQWKGSSKYNLKVRAPDKTVLIAEKSLPSLSNVKMVMFPSSGGPYGTYVIDIWNPESQSSKSSSWELFAFPGKSETTVCLQKGTGSKRNIFFEFKRFN